MAIHTSNYRVRGFTESVSVTALVELARKHHLRVIDDVGSGARGDFARVGFEGEPLPRQSIGAGADLVLFSGDKLLGGPQAGILAGRQDLIHAIEKDPLMRAFRLDKMTLAALEATLRLYLREEAALRDVPVLRMLGTPLAELKQRAETLAQRLKGAATLASIAVVEDVAYVGGGSLPDQALPTSVVEIAPLSGSDEQLARQLRLGHPAVMGRRRDGKVVLDVRTVFEEQVDDLVRCVILASRGP
jgi:L-seryl-tRNA(Ser) seleniumtransferase